MNPAPSSDDLARDLDSILSQSAPRPSNQNWPPPPTSNNQNWPPPPTSNNQKSEKRSIGRRMSRAFARYSIVFLIGIGATLAWQSYGDEAMEMVRTEAPSLAWLLPVSTAKPAPKHQATVPATAPDGQAAAAVVPSAELAEKLKPMAVDLDIVRRSVQQLATKVEQLAAKQDQMSHKQDQISQDITALQLVEQEVSQKLSAPPQSRAVPPRKPPQPTGQSSTVPPPPPSTGQR
jgi:outer membrane murein-binding lipoprotein Lpp